MQRTTLTMFSWPQASSRIHQREPVVLVVIDDQNDRSAIPTATYSLQQPSNTSDLRKLIGRLCLRSGPALEESQAGIEQIFGRGHLAVGRHAVDEPRQMLRDLWQQFGDRQPGLG
jgi:hypothetical protein